ncbi:MAG: response regulator transcription factor [Dehalococcoidia bacterium]|nr:MAG: response regulator transcription factor [Dehalococcoidia bacterium]
MPVIVVASTRPGLVEQLDGALAGHEFNVVLCPDGPKAIRTAFEHGAEAVVVDLRIGEEDALRVISVLHAASDLAIVAIASRHDVDGCVRAIEAGADDVTHPDTPAFELAARLRAALRRVRRTFPALADDAPTVRTGELTISGNARTVTKRGRPVHLSRTESRLLSVLAARPGEAMSYRLLLSSVWGRALSNDLREVRLYVSYLRSKLEDDPSQPRYLLTERGLGYRLALISPLDDDGDLEVSTATGATSHN